MRRRTKNSVNRKTLRIQTGGGRAGRRPQIECTQLQLWLGARAEGSVVVFGAPVDPMGSHSLFSVTHVWRPLSPPKKHGNRRHVPEITRNPDPTADSRSPRDHFPNLPRFFRVRAVYHSTLFLPFSKLEEKLGSRQGRRMRSCREAAPRLALAAPPF